MSRPRLFPTVFVALACAGALAVAAQETAAVTEAGVAEDEFPAALEAIRADLEATRFEKALTAIEAWLGRADLTEEQRFQLWLLRSQAHVAYGDLDAAEEDYRALLRLRPAYEPEPSLTPPKALERFRRVRDALVGYLVLAVQPPDASVSVDARPVRPDAQGRIPVLVGERTVRVEREGFDPYEQRVQVEAAQAVPLEVRLIPNARTLVVRTRPAGVTVRLDGRPVGQTENRPGLEPDTGELVLEAVPLGEHTFELAKPCYRPIVWTDLVSADLTDLAPKVYKPFVLEPARAVLELQLRDVPPEREVLLDGTPVVLTGVSPRVETCPGERVLEVRTRARVLWRAVLALEADEARTLRVAPRPNALLVGEGDLPAGWSEAVSVVGTVATPAGFDPSEPRSWHPLERPGVDLCVAPEGASRSGGRLVWLYSPWLRRTWAVEPEPFPQAPPWLVATAGLELGESDVGGASLVLWVRPSGPAARAGIEPGMRVVAVGGQPLADPGALGRALEAAGDRIALTVNGSEGRKELEVGVEWSPRLPWPAEGPLARAALAAWAAVAAATQPDPLKRATARANLALLVADAGRHELAADLFARADFPARAGVGAATVAYYLGRTRLALGDEPAAREAFRRALDPRATAFSDDGPPVAWAAADQLADLGEAVSAEAPAGR